VSKETIYKCGVCGFMNLEVWKFKGLVREDNIIDGKCVSKIKTVPIDEARGHVCNNCFYGFLNINKKGSKDE
jgi:hypothetical protein